MTSLPSFRSKAATKWRRPNTPIMTSGSGLIRDNISAACPRPSGNSTSAAIRYASVGSKIARPANSLTTTSGITKRSSSPSREQSDSWPKLTRPSGNKADGRSNEVPAPAASHCAKIFEQCDAAGAGTSFDRPSALFPDGRVNFGHESDCSLEGDDDLLVMPDVVVSEFAGLAIFEPTLAYLIAADVEFPDGLGHAAEILSRINPDPLVIIGVLGLLHFVASFDRKLGNEVIEAGRFHHM